MDTVVREHLTGPSSYSSCLGRALLVAVAYFAAARLALSAGVFAAGHEVAVWPASGIALACLLLFGLRVWPGIWLGAALAYVSFHTPLIDAMVLGAGGTLEAVAAALL